MCNVTQFRVANQPLPITPFRVHFWGWLTSMSSSIICEWPPRVLTPSTFITGARRSTRTPNPVLRDPGAWSYNISSRSVWTPIRLHTAPSKRSGPDQSFRLHWLWFSKNVVLHASCRVEEDPQCFLKTCLILLFCNVYGLHVTLHWSPFGPFTMSCKL